MDNFQRNITNTIINYGLAFISVVSLPLNIIVIFAIRNDQYSVIKFIPSILSGLVILLYFYRKRIQLLTKTRIFSSLLFFTGLYTLLLGLLDMAALWFILSIIFALFDKLKSISFGIFVSALFFVIATGLLMIFNNPYIPIDYGFENCHFACVSIRIINFLIIGFLIFKILKTFFSTIELYIKEILEKNIVLEQLKAIEKKEAELKLSNEKLKNNLENQEREVLFKRQQLSDATSKIIQFNTILENLKQQIENNNHKEAITNIKISQSNNYSLDKFKIQFNELYPNFIQVLKNEYPQLTETDINICVLVTSGLKSIVIADLLNVSETTIAKYRNRIRKKLNIESNADIADFLTKKHISQSNSNLSIMS